jgi:tetratricopeptide (TPR) repeat protein
MSSKTAVAASAETRALDFGVRQQIGVMAAILLATGLAYAPAAGGDFHWDDDLAVLANPNVVDPSGLGWKALIPPSLGRDRTLTDLTFAANRAISGVANAPFVFTNVAIHLLAVLLAFLAARAILQRVAHPRAVGLALASAAIFALHPLQTEAVSFVSQRAESLASALYLAALLAWLKAEERHPDRGWLGAFALGGAAFLAAVAAKGMALTLPFVGLLVVLLTGARRAHGRRYWLVAWGLPIAGAILLAIGAVAGLSGKKDAGLDAGELGPWRYLLTEGSVLLRYIRLLFWPAGQSVDHWVVGSPGLADAATLASCGVVLALIVGAIWLARRNTRQGARTERRVVALGVLWYFVILAPTSSFIPLQDPMAEHRVYLANLGLILGAVVVADWGLQRLLGNGRGRLAGVSLAVAVSVALCAGLVARNRLWQTDVALWSDAAAKAPLHYRPQLHAGNALWGKGAVAEALGFYQKAAALVPPRTAVWVALQRSFADRATSVGRYGEAQSALTTAIGEAPREVAFREALAWSRFSSGDMDGAVEEVKRARQTGLESGDLAGVAGKAAANRGDYATALRELRLSVELAPDSSLRRSDLAIVAKMAGLDGEACVQLGRFIELEKDAAMRGEGEKLRDQWRCAGR